jgi:hypothetical protein
VIKLTIVEGSFGSADRPECPQCSAPMKIVGRESHPDLGESYELQTFECTSCHHVMTRNADKDGKPSAEK